MSLGFKKGSKLYSIGKMKCPKCHEGDLFQSSILNGIYNMPSKCKVCTQPFELEPGFYWGAMYVSYGIQSFLFLTTALLGVFYFGLSVNAAMVIVIAECIVLFPFTARYSRAIWINLFVAYESICDSKNTLSEP